MKVKMKVCAMLGALALAVLPDALAQQGGDTKFLTEVIQGNLAEVRLGALAAERGQSEGVRDYGETLKEDHSAALEKTTALAKSLNVTVPTEPTAEAKHHYDALSKLSGAEFDRQFVAMMVDSHQKGIAKHEAQAKTGQDAKVKEFAEDILPTLREHLAKAQELKAKSGSSGI